MDRRAFGHVRGWNAAASVRRRGQPSEIFRDRVSRFDKDAQWRIVEFAGEQLCRSAAYFVAERSPGSVLRIDRRKTIDETNRLPHTRIGVWLCRADESHVRHKQLPNEFQEN
jgi:hypothetical protein